MILEELLQRVASGRAYSLSELAADLGVELDLVEQMIGDLVRAGYLYPIETSCNHHCEGCSLGEPCHVISEGRIWSVTDKGRRAARELQR